MIVKNKSGWYAVKCDCCGSTSFNEASKEDAVEAVRNSLHWAVVSSGGKAMKDYCPDCAAAIDRTIWARRKEFGL